MLTQSNVLPFRVPWSPAHHRRHTKPERPKRQSTELLVWNLRNLFPPAVEPQEEVFFLHKIM